MRMHSLGLQLQPQMQLMTQDNPIHAPTHWHLLVHITGVGHNHSPLLSGIHQEKDHMAIVAPR